MINFEDLIFNENGYADVVPSPIPNTTLQARRNATNDGIKSFQLTPVSGYIMHDKNYDEPVFGENDEETGEIILGFRRTTANFSGSYDFDVNPREFYTLPEDELPGGAAIYGAVNNPELA